MNASAWLLLAAVALPATTSLVGLLFGARTAEYRLGVVGGALAATAAAVLAAVVITTGRTGRIEVTGQAWLGLVADRLTVVLLMLVCLVNALVQVFAHRQLLGDPARHRFAVRAGFLISATAMMVSGASLITLALGWSLAGLALIALVALYWPAPAARHAAFYTGRMVLIGDLCLWAAVALYLTHGGHNDIHQLASAPGVGGATGAVIACLLVVAAAARCAQLPFRRWLPASLAAPTPVSALLHAGVVNAGGILLVRLSPIVASSWWATGLTLAITAFGTVAATLIMLARPDIKGALVYSTTAQMAFLLLACSTGLLAAAVSHLVAHGMFKATMFLGSGSTVTTDIRHRDEPSAAHLGGIRMAALGGLALAVSGISVIVLARVLHPESRASGTVLMIFAAVTAAAAGWGWLRRRPTASGVAVALVALPLVSGGYLAVLTGLTHFLAPALAPVGPAAAPAWTFGAVLLLLLAAGALPAKAARWEWLHARLYARILAAGQPLMHVASSVAAPAAMPAPIPTAALTPAFATATVSEVATTRASQTEGAHL